MVLKTFGYPLKLYASDNSGNAWKVRILLGLLGVPCEIENIDFFNRGHKSAEFLKLNPRGQVPVMEIEGQVFWDTTAHLVYIARKWGGEQWLPTEPLAMAEVMHWMAFAQNDIQNGLQSARGIIKQLKTGSLIESQQLARSALDIMQARLATREWMAVGRPTIADIACYPYTALAHEAGMPLDSYTHVVAWLRRCEALPRWPQRKH